MKLTGLVDVTSTYNIYVLESYPSHLSSGQVRDLPIISPRGNMKMLSVSQKPTETTQFFQDHGHSPHL